MKEAIHPLPHLSIPSSRWWFRASRAGGPGGQHVNTTASRVELVFAVRDCVELTAGQQNKIFSQLASRCSSAGELRLVTAANRSQQRNKEALVERLENLLTVALKPRPKRRATRPPAAAKRRRLDNKKKRSQTKSARRRPDWPET